MGCQKVFKSEHQNLSESFRFFFSLNNISLGGRFLILTFFTKTTPNFDGAYSQVSNKRAVWNKREG